MNPEDIVSTFIEIELPDNDSFLKIKETLTRVGISSNRDKKLYQSCHVLHKKGKYYIVHFKELFSLDGKDTDFDEDDLGRRNTIANLLAEWGLVKIVDPIKSKDPISPLSHIKVISYAERSKWELITKYSIGNNIRKTN